MECSNFGGVAKRTTTGCSPEQSTTSSKRWQSAHRTDGGARGRLEASPAFPTVKGSSFSYVPSAVPQSTASNCIRPCCRNTALIFEACVLPSHALMPLVVISSS
eukprot:GHVS01089346.1.p1 GENE.GHVS01089346.1~~GHVS01089346.1.p1  ORF type:complete len:104 (+),score=10.91 GHVS01089346.1:1340-1651(+)